MIKIEYYIIKTNRINLYHIYSDTGKEDWKDNGETDGLPGWTPSIITGGEVQ